MLLALDVGNTQTVVGLYDGELLQEHWRTTSVRSRTADELAVELSGLLAIRGRSFGDVSARRDGAHAPRA
jgi:type III pantothenate kinase